MEEDMGTDFREVKHVGSHQEREDNGQDNRHWQCCHDKKIVEPGFLNVFSVPAEPSLSDRVFEIESLL